MEPWLALVKKLWQKVLDDQEDVDAAILGLNRAAARQGVGIAIDRIGQHVLAQSAELKAHPRA